MSKRSRILLLTLLAGSLGLNAWQFAQRSSKSTDATGASASDSPGGLGAMLQRVDSAAEKLEGLANPLSVAEVSDLAAALAIVDPLERMQALIGVVRNLPADELGPLLEELRDGKGAKDPRNRLLTNLLLTRWGQVDADGAFASLGKVSAKQGGGAANAILAGLAAVDPARAVAWLTAPDNTMQHQPWLGHQLASTLATEWARQDPEAALDWARGLDAGDQRMGAYAGIIDHLMESDPEQAAGVAMELSEGERPKLLGQVAESWAEQEPTAAVEWANSLELPRERSQALEDALSGWARSEPGQAASYVDELPLEERAALVGDLARTWAEREPAAAAEWLGSQEESGGKAEAMGHVMWNWTSQDPESASAWLAGQEPGASFDAGASGLAKAATHAFQDGEAGVRWSSAIQNEELRATMTRHTLRQWMGQDPSAASAWAESNGVEVPSGARGK